MKIAFLGLGTMGSPMALNLIKAGHEVAVYNRTKERELPLAQAGAVCFESPALCAGAAEVIITCVSDTPDVEQLILGPGGIIEGAAQGAVVVDMSTISPAATQAMAARLAEKGIAMVDAPVSGGSEGAEQGTLAVMVGGEAKAVERVRPLLEVLGAKVTHLGPVGSGQMAKAINQTIIAGVYQGVAEGVALGLAAGLDMEQVVQAIGGGAAGSWVLANRAGNMIRDQYPLGFRLRLHKKDLAIALQAASELELDLPVSKLVGVIEDDLIERGLGDQDMSVLAKSVRKD